MTKRILVCSEASHLNTGYSVMYAELLKRLYADGFELAEHATYGEIGDKQKYNIPWKYYPNDVADTDYRKKEYKSNDLNQFGLWRFDKVCLHFKPDIVFACRDIWMDQHIVTSPLSEYFTSILAPPIDSTPQPTIFHEAYEKADYLMPLSQWGCDVIEKELNKKCTLLSAGVDSNIFRPMNKDEVREKWGVPKDAIVFGSVMRNQPRKLFPMLIKCFGRFLDEQPSRRRNHFLYLHTSYPDKKGWNIPELLVEYGCTGNAFTTYKCGYCLNSFSSLYGDARKICQICGGLGAKNPTVNVGLSREELAEVYNLFNFYFQISEKEGFGMILPEAAACGIKFAAPMYSAMVSAVNNLGGIPIQPKCLVRDYDNNTDICIPDEDRIVEIMGFWDKCKTDHLRENAIKHYSWDGCYQNLKSVIDKIEPKNKWGVSAPIFTPPTELDHSVPLEKFVDYIYNVVLNRPQDRYSKSAMGLQRDLLYGTMLTDGGYSAVDLQQIFNLASHKAYRRKWCEERRQGLKELEKEDFLYV